MKNFITKYDIEYHFKRNSGYYFCFILAILFSFVISAIVIISNDNYLNLIISPNKVLYSLINGNAVLKNLFWSRFISFSVPLILVVILGLNFYLCLLSLILVSYQFSIFIMTVFAIVTMYGMAGVIESIFLIVPLNLMYFCILIFLSVVCLERSKLAIKYKTFNEGYGNYFFIKLIVCFILVFVLSLIVSFIYPMILKSAIFSIY